MKTIYAPMAKVMAKDMADLLASAGFAVADASSGAEFCCMTFDKDAAGEDLSRFGLNPVLVDKRGSCDLYETAGVEAIPSLLITSRSVIESASFERMFAKPSVGTAKVSVSPFDYKTYASKAAALAAFDADTTDSLATRKPVLQPSFANADGETSLLLCNGAVNGAGQIYFEPVIEATHREDYGPVYKTVRGAIEGTDDASFVKDATARIVATAGIRNTLFSLQFIRGEGKLYPMDFQYRFDYFNRYAFRRMGYDHPLNILRFAYDEAATVDSSVADICVMRAIKVGSDKDVAYVKQKMAEFGMVFVDGQPSPDARVKVFIGMASTREEALARMDAFEEALQ